MTLSLGIFLFITWYFTVGYLVTNYGDMAKQIKEAEKRTYDVLRIGYIMKDKPEEVFKARWPYVRFTFRLVCILLFPLLGVWKAAMFILNKEWKTQVKKDSFRPKSFCYGSANVACLECGYRKKMAFNHFDLHQKVLIRNIQCKQCLTFQKRKVSIFTQPWNRHYGTCDQCHNQLQPSEYLHCPVCKTQHITFRRIVGSALPDQVDKLKGEKKQLAKEILRINFVLRMEKKSIVRMVKEKEKQTGRYTKITSAKNGPSKLKKT